MQVKEFNGRRATNRAGAAEYLGMPLNTVRMYSSPAQRHRRGWPEPVPKDLLDAASAREDWFYLDQLDSRRPQPGPPPPVVHDPERLLSLAEFAALRGVDARTMQSYVEDSLQAWAAGRDGTLPLPDDTQPARHGSRYRWRHDRAVAWTSPRQPRRSPGRPAGRRPTIDDVRAVLAAPEHRGAALTAREIADELTARLGTDVSPRTVQRLRAQLVGRET